MRLFDKVQKLSHKQSKEIAAFCGIVALLLLVAGFIAGGGTIGNAVALNNISPASQTALDFNCIIFGSQCGGSNRLYYAISANTTTITPGQQVQLTWTAYSSPSGLSWSSCLQNYIGSYSACSIS